jgi:hypothetical protein
MKWTENSQWHISKHKLSLKNLKTFIEFTLIWMAVYVILQSGLLTRLLFQGQLWSSLQSISDAFLWSFDTWDCSKLEKMAGKIIVYNCIAMNTCIHANIGAAFKFYNVNNLVYFAYLINTDSKEHWIQFQTGNYKIRHAEFYRDNSDYYEVVPLGCYQLLMQRHCTFIC